MKQRIGTIILVSGVVIAFVVVFFVSNQRTEPQLSWSVDSTAIRLFEDSLVDLQAEYEAKWSNSDSLKYKKQSLPSLSRHPFDPNIADSIELLEQGFKPWQVGNMMKYRAKGGRWRKADDVRKIYGVDSVFFAEIEPYIVISDSLLAHADSSSGLDTTKIHFAVKKDTVIELNSADTTKLQIIRHIGSYTARQIVRYRDKLGGYCSVSQITEIKELPDETYDLIKDNLIVDASLIKTVNVNHASVNQLARHPYIRAEQAKAIYTYRRNNMRIKNLSELNDLHIFTSDEWQRLLPYLSL